MAPKGRKPGLSEEERALWRQVTRDTQPIKKPPRPAAPPESEAPKSGAPPSSSSRATPPTPSRKPGSGARKPAAKAPTPRPQKRAPPALGHGDIADLDKRSAERLRRGRMAVEATLDLHGHSQEQARQELAAFLARAQGAGKRCVRVVTGKGDITQGGGVLRAQVPHWLNEPENRPRVLAFDYAPPQHGGLGALHVLLRKVRP